MAAPLKVGLAGLGTVGASVVRLLEQHRASLAAGSGRPIQIVAVSARSKAKKRGVDLKKFRWVSDPVALASDPGIDVFVELIGGEGGTASKGQGREGKQKRFHSNLHIPTEMVVIPRPAIICARPSAAAS